jgi:putative MATE family efflux protein
MSDADPPQPETDSASRKRRLGIPGLRGAILGAGDPAPPATPKPSKQNQKQLSGKLAGLSLPKQVFVLALWPLLEQVMNFLVGLVDMAIAGRLPGENASLDALDAIGVASYFVWLMTILQAAVGVGAAAIVSRAVGASHRRLANAGSGQAIVLGIGSGVFAGAVIFVAAPWIASIFGLQGVAQQMAADYIRITALGIPMCGALFTGSAVLRAAGDTRSPFLAMVAVNLVNVVVSIGLGGLRVGEDQVIGLGLGVNGIAWGTALAWTVGGLVVLVILLSGRSELRLRPHRLRPHWHTMRRIIKVALPNLYFQLAFWGINLGLLIYIVFLDVEGAYGAHSIAMRIKSISFLPGFAISVAASTLTGQYLGLGDPQRARRATYIAMCGAMSLMTVCSFFFFFMPEMLVSLISPDEPQHVALAAPLLKLAALDAPFLAMHLILYGAMQGAGDTRNTAILNLVFLVLLRLVGAYIFAFPLGMGLWGIWLGIVTDLIVRAIVFYFYYQTNRWAKTTV